MYKKIKVILFLFIIFICNKAFPHTIRIEMINPIVFYGATMSDYNIIEYDIDLDLYITNQYGELAGFKENGSNIYISNGEIHNDCTWGERYGYNHPKETWAGAEVFTCNNFEEGDSFKISFKFKSLFYCSDIWNFEVKCEQINVYVDNTLKKSYSYYDEDSILNVGRWYDVGTVSYSDFFSGSDPGDPGDPGDPTPDPPEGSSAPPNFSATAISATQIALDWDHVSYIPEYRVPWLYKIYRKNDGDEIYEYCGYTHADTTPPGTYYVDSGLSPGTRYYYLIFLKYTSEEISEKAYAVRTTRPRLNISSPVSGAKWIKALPYNISWSTEYTNSNVRPSNVNIYLLKGGSTVMQIAGNTENDGSHDFIVPAYLASGTDYRVQIVAGGDSSVQITSDYFEIMDKPEVHITSPGIDNFLWYMNSSYNINWNYTQSINNFQIELLNYSDKNKIMDIGTKTTSGGTGTFSWKVPMSDLIDTSTFHYLRVKYNTYIYEDQIFLIGPSSILILIYLPQELMKRQRN